jgi:hypothetical protein
LAPSGQIAPRCVSLSSDWIQELSDDSWSREVHESLGTKGGPKKKGTQASEIVPQWNNAVSPNSILNIAVTA